jgi:hypothetical protein
VLPQRVNSSDDKSWQGKERRICDYDKRNISYRSYQNVSSSNLFLLFHSMKLFVIKRKLTLQFHLVTFFTISGFRFVFVRFCVACIYVFIYVICILRRLVSNTLMLVSLSRNLTSHTSGSGTDNPSGTRAFTLDIQWDSRWLVIG